MQFITKEYFVYLLSIYGSSIMRSVYKILIVRMLGPAQYGLWSTLSLILLLGNVLDFGLTYAFVKEASFSRGKGKLREANEIKAVVFTAMSAFALCASALLLASSFFFFKSNNAVFWLLAAIALLLLLQQTRNFVMSWFIVEKRFAILGLVALVQTFFTGMFSLVFVDRVHLIGLPLSFAVGNALFFLYVVTRFKGIFQIRVVTARLSALLKVGFPIMAIAAAYTLFFTIERVLIFRFMGKESVGYYGIASSLGGFFLLFPLSSGVFLFPRLSEQFAAQGCAQKLQNSVYRPTIILAFVASALAGIAYIFLPLAIRLFLPQFAAGTNAAKISLFGIVFFSVSIFSQKFLIVINRQLQCLYIVAGALLCKAALVFVSLKMSLGIEGVAFASVAVYCLYATSILVAAARHCRSSFSEIGRFLLKVYLPLCYLSAVMLLSRFVCSHFSFFGESLWGSLMWQSAVLAFFVLVPFSAFVKKRWSQCVALFSPSADLDASGRLSP
jgi:O-antigen/teichoic acid export membrane protein